MCSPRGETEETKEYGALLLRRRNELQEARHRVPKSTKGGNSRAKGDRTQPSSENPQRCSVWARRKLTCIPEKKKKKNQEKELGGKPSNFLFNHKIYVIILIVFFFKSKTFLDIISNLW